MGGGQLSHLFCLISGQHQKRRELWGDEQTIVAMPYYFWGGQRGEKKTFWRGGGEEKEEEGDGGLNRMLFV